MEIIYQELYQEYYYIKLPKKINQIKNWAVSYLMFYSFYNIKTTIKAIQF